MQIASKSKAIIMAACLLVALAFGGTAAVAAGGWPTSGENSLTINATDSTDQAFVEDIAKANVVVDVVKIADATPNGTYQMFDYTLVTPYDTEEAKALLEQAMVPGGEGAAVAWKNLAKAAAEQAPELIPGGTVAVGDTLSGQADGLYLLLPHGDGITDGYVAISKKFKYTFDPVVVALPTHEGGTTAASDGNWDDEVVVPNLKPSQEPLFGKLRIWKSVENFSGEQATFEFEIVATDGSGYQNLASIQYTGEKTYVDVDMIPAGTTVKVTETYQGGRYELKTTVKDEAEIVSYEEAGDDEDAFDYVEFINEPNGNDIPGHGINNEFTAGKDDWIRHSTPTQEGFDTEEPEAEPTMK